MKKLIQICFMLCLVSSAIAQDQDYRQTQLNAIRAEKVLRVYNWQDVQLPLTNSEVVSMDGESVLKIENTNLPAIDQQGNAAGGKPLEVVLLKITDPSVLRKMDSLSFDVKFENVSGVNSHFYQATQSGQDILAGDYYFSNKGDASFKLTAYSPPDVPGSDQITNEFRIPFGGQSNWKRFNFLHIPGKNENPPSQMELRVRLPGTGTIYIRPLMILAVKNNWWSAQQAGLIGGIGGSLIGCLSALVGFLAGMGKARRFVLTTTVILIVAGILLVIAGIIAVATKQPYPVWYPLMLGGAILTFVLSINIYSIKRRYEDKEIRRMTSMDAMGR